MIDLRVVLCAYSVLFVLGVGKSCMFLFMIGLRVSGAYSVLIVLGVGKRSLFTSDRLEGWCLVLIQFS